MISIQSIKSNMTHEMESKIIETSASSLGVRFTQINARTDGKSFQHIVTLKELLQYAPELIKDELFKQEDFDSWNTNNNLEFDFSHDELAISNQIIADIIEKILVGRNSAQSIELRRGDSIRLQCIGYRGYGTYFYDGKHIVMADLDPNSDYGRFPKDFLVPTEFPIDYWDGINFVGYGPCGEFNFDTKLLPEELDWKFLTAEYGGSVMYANLNINGINWYIFSTNDSEKPFKKLTNKNLKRHRDIYQEFRANGTCHNIEQMGNYFSNEKLAEVLGVPYNDLINRYIVIKCYRGI